MFHHTFYHERMNFSDNDVQSCWMDKFYIKWNFQFLKFLPEFG